jgi:hypothetical protein
VPHVSHVIVPSIGTGLPSLRKTTLVTTPLLSPGSAADSDSVMQPPDAGHHSRA